MKIMPSVSAEILKRVKMDCKLEYCQAGHDESSLEEQQIENFNEIVKLIEAQMAHAYRTGYSDGYEAHN